ncbi:MAG: transposase [Thermodesulfobacteriota bacterium]
MSRPLRIEFPDAWYHVLNRGRRGESIFHDARDYQIFLQTVQEACELWYLRVAAYCLLPNHYHLLVQTPSANLSRCMRHIDGVYTQRFNRRHGHDGPLFRGRYKSLLIEADTYLLQLVRYIHRNPLGAGLAQTLDEYPWSSHLGYLSRSSKWKWLYKEPVLEMFAANSPARMEAYRKFVFQEDNKELQQLFSRKRWPVFLGSEKFIALVKRRFFSKKVDSEVPQRRELAPALDTLLERVARSYRVELKDLFYSRRGHINEARNVAIYLARRLRGDRLREIGEVFKIRRYSSVSSIVERMKMRIGSDERLRKKIDHLISTIEMSQEQT